MRNFQLPLWLGSASQPTAGTFAALFSLDAIARTLLITIVPLKAHALLGDAQKVSVLYFAISVVGLFGSLAIPWLVHRLRRRWVFSLGVGSFVAATGLYVLPGLPALVAALILQVLGAACVEVTLNLYVMDHIARRDIARFEPMRVFFAAGAWAIGPWLGVYVAERVGQEATFALAALGALFMLGYFWFLRVTENPAVARVQTLPPNPLRYLPRFFSQPRLVLAWALAIGRAGWWTMFFIYAPIYAVTAGFDPVISGAIVSVGNMSLFLVPLWGWFGQRYGIQRLLVIGYTLAGGITVAVAFAAHVPWLGITLLVVAALAASIIDGAGNVPFLRAVRPLERPEMTAVFGTFRHTSQLVTPGLFAVLLKLFALPAVFLAGGAIFAALAYLARYIPRQLK